VGKGTVVAAVRTRLPWVEFSISATTRAPRPGEVDGRDYYFVSDTRFDDLIAHDELLEWARYAGTRYGTPRRPVLDAVARGIDVILEIDVQGARQVRRTMPAATSVFIAPPSLSALRERLTGRGTETAERVEARLAAAESELAARDEFDVVIVNDRLETAVDELVELISHGSGHREGPSTSMKAKITHEHS
jgi:guanylate kinase